jgi:hypothetical protein
MLKPVRIARLIISHVACFLLFAVIASGQASDVADSRPSAAEAAQTSGGFTAHNDRETLEMTVCSDAVIHVTARPIGVPPAAEAQPWMLPREQACPGAAFQFSQTTSTQGGPTTPRGATATLTTARLAITLALRDASLSFKTANGEALTH